MDFRMYFVTIEHGNALFMRHGFDDYEVYRAEEKNTPGHTKKRENPIYIYKWSGASADIEGTT